MKRILGDQTFDINLVLNFEFKHIILKRRHVSTMFVLKGQIDSWDDDLECH
jgi:hypothetical protein